MTGLPTLLVQLEDSAGDFTHDITAYVKLVTGWDVRRGRNDEDDEIEPGAAHLTLNNNASTFTLGSPAFDGIATDKRVRISETIGATTYVRFTGYVQDWPVTWTSPMATTAECKVTAIDRQARFNRRNLRSVVENEILLDSPIAYYTLGEAAGSTSAGDTSGNGVAPLTMAGTGTAVVFGNAVGPGTDGLTAAEFAGPGQFLQGGAPVLTGAYTVEMFFLTAGDAGLVDTSDLFADNIGLFTSFGDIVANVGGVVLSASGLGASNGSTHHVAVVREAGGAVRLYFDGALVDSGVGAAAPVTQYLRLGNSTVPVTLAHVALYDTALPVARILAHSTSGVDGFETETADERVARLLAYAGVATADMDLEVGEQPSITQATTSGQKVSAALADVMAAEGGTLFIAGDGKATMHNKSHRVTAATSAASLVLTTDDIDPDSVEWAADKDYLVNTVSVTREGGAAQTSVNVASVTQYDEYPADRTGLLLPTDALALNLAQWLSGRYGDVLPRLASFTLDLLTLPQATVMAALALELGDRVTISGMPTQSPVATADLIVEGIKEEQSKGAWRLTFNTAPSSLFHAWVLGDATYGVLDSTTRLHF